MAVEGPAVGVKDPAGAFAAATLFFGFFFFPAAKVLASSSSERPFDHCFSSSSAWIRLARLVLIFSATSAGKVASSSCTSQRQIARV